METRAEWLEARRQYIGGSEVAAILGLSRWKSQWDVYMSKKGELEEAPEEKSIFKRGRFLEPAVGAWYAEETGTVLSHTSPFYLHIGPEPWMAASPDALVNDGAWGLECKTSRSMSGWGEDGTDKVPVDYSLQCHWYMACTGLKRWDVAVFFTVHDEFRKYRINFDQGISDHIVDSCRAWREKYIVGDEKPPIDGSAGASQYLKDLFPEPKESTRSATQVEEVLIRALKAARDEEKAAKTKGEHLKNQLAEKIGDNEGLRFGENKAMYKAETRTTIDSTALKAEYPDIASKFERTSTNRVMRITIKE